MDLTVANYGDVDMAASITAAAKLLGDVDTDCVEMWLWYYGGPEDLATPAIGGDVTPTAMKTCLRLLLWTCGHVAAAAGMEMWLPSLRRCCCGRCGDLATVAMCEHVVSPLWRCGYGFDGDVEMWLWPLLWRCGCGCPEMGLQPLLCRCGCGCTEMWLRRLL